MSGCVDLYVCENCHLMGAIHEFSDDCTPGFTHGRLIKILGWVRDGQEQPPADTPEHPETSSSDAQYLLIRFCSTPAAALQAGGRAFKSHTAH